MILSVAAYGDLCGFVSGIDCCLTCSCLCLITVRIVIKLILLGYMILSVAAYGDLCGFVSGIDCCLTCSCLCLITVRIVIKYISLGYMCSNSCLAGFCNIKSSICYCLFSLFLSLITYAVSCINIFYSLFVLINQSYFSNFDRIR